jgi:hypothetical protein
LLITLMGGAGGLLLWLLAWEPELYARAQIEDAQERLRLSQEFEKRAFDLVNEIQNEDDWQAEFTEQQVNGWLAEDFVESNLARQMPQGISEPRVAFQPGRLFLAFRYGGSSLSTVVSLQARVWIAPREPNTIAVEIERLRAGVLPIPLSFVQEAITEGSRQHNIDVQWYRREGNPVAIFRLHPDRRDPGIVLRELELGQGTIRLRGLSLDPGIRGSLEWPFSPGRPGSP